MFTTVHKYYTVEEWKTFAENNEDVIDHIAASSGTNEGDFERLKQILTEVPALKFICLDVANGYSQHFVEFVRRVRAAFTTHTIIVSNPVEFWF